MDTPQICDIWNTTARVTPADRGTYIFESPRAGGKYQVDSRALDNLSGLSDKIKVRLTDWLVEKREEGEDTPEITIYVLKSIEDRPDKSPFDCLKSFMVYLSRHCKAGEIITISDEFEDMLMAYSSFLETEELISCVNHCVSEGYLECLNRGSRYRMTMQGKIFATQSTNEDIKNYQCFVAMWFDDCMQEVYDKAIKLGIEDAGYKPYRVNDDPHIERIDERIISKIMQSQFILADFTSEKDNPRGSVYFEAGLAYGLARKIIWTCRKDLIEQHIPFDTRQFNHIGWELDNLDKFRKDICNSIVENIGKGKYKNP